MIPELPFPDLDARFDFVRAMRGTPQDPVHHAEGDVWIHTRMVTEALLALPAFRALPPEERAIAWTAAVLHDVGKPQTTRTDDAGKVTSQGHSTRGAALARRILWRMNAPFASREHAVAIVRHHQAPFWLLEREDPRSLVLRISLTARCDLLALVAEADARGRTCADQARILENVELFRTYAEEHGCLTAPFAFASDHARFLHLRGALRDPSHAPHEAFRCEVVVMSGLPGSGKDHWIATNLPGWPVVSLDRIRGELGVGPEDDQGAVIQAAREEAREHLRAGRSFAWSATNLSRRIRAQCIRLFSDYDARVRIVYVEVPEAQQRAQNRARRAVVPDRALDAMLEHWEVPDRTEAHEITYAVGSLG